MPIPDNQKLQVAISMLGGVASGGSGTRNALFTFHFRRTANVLLVPKAPIDAAFQTAIASPIASALNARYTQTGNTVRFINDAQDQAAFFAHALPGLVAGDSLSTFESCFILKRTGLRGKNFRGNNKLFPMSEADTTTGTDDLFNAAALARLGAVAAALLAGFTDATGNIWVPQVFSKSLSQDLFNPTNIIANDVIQTAVNKRVGSMLRRKVRSAY